MPSLVRFAHEILSEDRYGYAALQRVDQRIAALNDAQLVGMVKHLSGSRSRARSSLWRYANECVLESVTVELDAREAEQADIEAQDYAAHREEREAEELEHMRAAERAAAEKQISRTADREAREDVEKLLKDFRAKARLKYMVDSYRARSIRSWAWWFSAITLITMSIIMNHYESTKMTAVNKDQIVIGICLSFVIVISFFIGWRWGEVLEDVKTDAEVEEMVDVRKAEKLAEFFERDRVNRQIIELAELEDMKERRERMAARKKEKRRMKRIEKDRKTKIDADRKALEAKRKNLYTLNDKHGARSKRQLPGVGGQTKSDGAAKTQIEEPHELLDAADAAFAELGIEKEPAQIFKSKSGFNPNSNGFTGLAGVLNAASEKAGEPDLEMGLQNILDAAQNDVPETTLPKTKGAFGMNFTKVKQAAVIHPGEDEKEELFGGDGEGEGGGRAVGVKFGGEEEEKEGGEDGTEGSFANKDENVKKRGERKSRVGFVVEIKKEDLQEDDVSRVEDM